MTARSIAVAALVAMGLLAPASATAAASHGLVVRMSDERTVTYWTNPLTNALIHSAPNASSRPVGRLHAFTEDGFPEVYVILAREWSWFQIAFPGRPNGRVGWVRNTDLEVPELNVDHLVIDRSRLRATLYRRGHAIFTAPVGIGTPSDPTPGGTFWVREKFAVASDAAYGPYAFGTSAYSNTLTDWPGGGVVGIHGTDQPRLVPGRPSHGCIRLRNADIARLYRLMPIGTPITVTG